ncbi:DUF1289 domain-containing protein [Hyphomicrobium sp.]|uniref:DUF1289 domain-containing protein n=1 Tax=Hyphomicrobium sp. TaxID=82 RepID=UPI002CA02FB4|nr:DUF1289 domain-containing protein [Hyphomicrobium sp.]HVZ03998.1 DUF1289 domain-containing protein [Hyphomicrobium sp.]
MTRHSPCVGICQVDEATGFCIGCGRSRSEIGDWISMTESQRDEVWAKLPKRLADLSINVRLLPLTQAELVEWTKRTIADRLGTWVTGSPGAVAEFPCTSDRKIETETSRETIIARAFDASFRLRVSDKVRAFAFGEDGPIVLGLPKARASVTSNTVVESLGPDADAIDDEHREDQLFDFGIGRKSSRFCIRTDNEALSKSVAAQTGKHWSQVMPEIGVQLLSMGPNRVVESAAARIEVFTPIPLPGTQSPSGAHTHFLPEYLKSGEEIPASLTLPEFALPVAIFYPKAGSA